MTIRFIPNDPRSKNPPHRKIKPRPDRKASAIGFTFPKMPVEAEYPQMDPDFVAWQSREAALLTLEVIDGLGVPIVGWRGKATKKTIKFVPIDGADTNAYYDPKLGVMFDAASIGGKDFFASASVDIVAHEIGHGILDALRPELFDSNYFEVAAFHEAFGDCIAMTVALHDDETRRLLLKSKGGVDKANFVEVFGEDLSNAIGLVYGKDQNAAKPRRGLNKYKWAFHDTLPDKGHGLIGEVHSFGQVFSGCFLDVIRNIFANAKKKDSSTLLAATRSAATLLLFAATKAPHEPRFFASVGRVMALEDERLNGGKNRLVISDAFEGHNLLLGSRSLVSPISAVSKKKFAAGSSIGSFMKSNIRGFMPVIKGLHFTVREMSLGPHQVAETSRERPVKLDGISEKLAGCVALAVEPVLTGRSGGHAAFFTALPDERTTDAEVRQFVSYLMKMKQIDFDGTKKSQKTGAVAIRGKTTTHQIISKGNEKIVMRTCFSCRSAVSRTS